ncbi:SEC-C domain-containing protein [Geodermatophilus sp. YIM 151500]|uniref:SEC-C domain-containing protein n=1 Tax=Geodermatophilus sp. YIM 151500 TaxID=2984531 RepID=UPI0021E40579|nr:SEC-C domain-containing protein [Geodermatophilus sp. YIM 151500]MCV2490560.1 SEC-C domain-containing protein [Geodermatophilus sp. YIM 151500]
MARSATTRRPNAPAAPAGKTAAAGAVHPKAPCPCGSGRRYKHCHGSGYAPPVTRPFEGLPGEADWVALRELVPAATAPLKTADGRTATLASVLPGGAPALVRANREILLGAQLQTSSDDVSRDLGTALAAALEAPAGAPVEPGPIGGAGSAGPRLQELLDLDAPLEVTVHDDFSFWLEGTGAGPEAQAMLERANEAVLPTVRLAGLGAAYWVRPGSERAHLRWVRPEPEEQLLDALARLRASGEILLGEGTRYAGAFRAHGLVVPVWDLPADTPAGEWTGPATEFQTRLEQALASSEPLDADQRRARAGLLSRQITLR